ncbi:Cupin domain-containing protein [Marinitoga hydrogenitolerans DSM 16785]|uniref:Cupin domain-containing protein n=1 Tax=Marinitoga hydrogenitolerans (strain DSM 16785 / JCM 12826 / AT1271) TaxID=1122195 RepID=A0A1M5AC41_MARH1|nr:cupin domain-containing protein [Marinitoga hydrogenitolerans]SHF27858.1 Cupin domain-containing protein [Marinitoga hydrogenitolerans DSM 16785]
MKIVKYDSLEKLSGVNFDARKLLTSKKLEIVLISLESGEVVKKHSTPFDAIFFISKGKGVVELSDEKINVNENDMIYCDKNVEHGITNNSNDRLNVLVIKLLK